MINEVVYILQSKLRPLEHVEPMYVSPTLASVLNIGVWDSMAFVLLTYWGLGKYGFGIVNILGFGTIWFCIVNI